MRPIRRNCLEHKNCNDIGYFPKSRKQEAHTNQIQVPKRFTSNGSGGGGIIQFFIDNAGLVLMPMCVKMCVEYQALYHERCP